MAAHEQPRRRGAAGRTGGPQSSSCGRRWRQRRSRPELGRFFQCFDSSLSPPTEFGPNIIFDDYWSKAEKPSLPFIVWKDSYRTHIPEIDADHAHLLVVANYLYEAVSRGGGKQVVRGALDELCSYTETHFAAEEALMAASAYPDLASHHGEHVKFLARVHGLAADPSHVLAEDLLDTLRRWLLHHFLRTDREYLPYVKAHLGPRP